MRALEKYLGLSGLNYNAEKKIRNMQERVKQTVACVDSSAPHGWETRGNVSPSKRFVSAKERNDQIQLDNSLLARRIFNIMDAPGMISEVISDTRHLDVHPGTMNFKARLTEAQRIHHHNMLIAERLDKIKPFYGKNDLHFDRSLIPPRRKKAPIIKLKKKKIFDNMDAAFRAMHADGSQTHRAGYNDGGSGSGGGVGAVRDGFLSARSANSEDDAKTQRVLLEYTKIQDGRVLDVAVIKEPFRDRYAIFGIDIDDGNKFELRLSSEEVSNILDGDMLVTNVDNVEVWMALLNKVLLTQVEDFSKLPSTADPEDIIKSGAKLRAAKLNAAAAAKSSGPKAAAAVAVPTKPLSSRPSSKIGGRPGSRIASSRGGTGSAGAGAVAGAGAAETFLSTTTATEQEQQQTQQDDFQVLDVQQEQVVEEEELVEEIAVGGVGVGGGGGGASESLSLTLAEVAEEEEVVVVAAAAAIQEVADDTADVVDGVTEQERQEMVVVEEEQNQHQAQEEEEDPYAEEQAQMAIEEQQANADLYDPEPRKATSVVGDEEVVEEDKEVVTAKATA